MTHYESRLDTATSLFNAGFTAQAGKKKVNTLLGNAFSTVKNELQNTILEQRSECDCEDQKAHLDALYWAIPELHNWRAKHDVLLAAYPDHVAKINKLVELRQATKDAEIIKIEKNTADVKIEVVRKTIMDEMLRKKTQFIEGLKLAKLFGGLSVSVNAHRVINEKGTEFLRHFFYLEGKLTALSMIIAISEGLED